MWMILVTYFQTIMTNETILFCQSICYQVIIPDSTKKLEKKYASALDNYEQSCFVRSDFKKMKCVCNHKKL
jgi:hypothetical protein